MQIKEINVSRPVCFNIGQQYSNEVLVIHFKGLPDLPNKYIYVKKDNYEKEVPLVGDLYVVSRPLTTYSGEVKAQIIARDPGSAPIALTPNFKMMITPSNYSGIGEDENYPDDPNIKNYYVKIDGKIQSMDELIALVQSVTLNNITLNAIPVSSGGNVTINGQQYIADYVDVERGKIVKFVEKYRIPSDLKWMYEPSENNRFGAYGLNININPNFGRNTLFTHYQNAPNGVGGFIAPGNIRLHNFQGFTDVITFKEWLDKNELYAYFAKNTLEEIDLTPEEVQALKELATYYPVTNISVNSEQLDGYTVFNYPISMANGWNYVKQQLNDNRDYIYDMDLQSAEAYVNSEYAVTLTELEV